MSSLLENARGWYYLHKKEILFFLIIFLVSTLSFGLGYLANREFTHAPIIIEKCSEEPSARQ